jgi:hypothetical protein
VTAVGAPRDAGGNIQGGVAVSADGKTVTYTPPAGFQGAVAFPYTVSDGKGGTATATVRVAVVNDDPTPLDDGGITDPATAITLMVVANDSDANGDPVTIGGVIQAGHGAVSFDPAAGTVTYTPVATYAGIDTFSYTVGDGRGRSGTAQVTVTVGPVSDPTPPASEGVVPPVSGPLPRTGGGPWLPAGLTALGFSILFREWARRRRGVDPGGRLPADSIGPPLLR